jgi:hypothetical protein
MAFFGVTHAAEREGAVAPDLEPVRGPAPDPVRGLYRALGNRSLADLGPTGPGGTTVARQLGGGLHLGPDPVPAPAGPASAAPTTAPTTSAPATVLPAPVVTTDVPRPPDPPQVAAVQALDASFLAKLLVGFGMTPATVAGWLADLPLPVDSAAPYWGVPQVGTYVDTLARGWTTRLTAAKRPLDPLLRAELVKDYGETMEGAFARLSVPGVRVPGGLAAPFSQLPDRVRALLRKRLAELTRKSGQDEAVIAELITFRQRIDHAITSYRNIAAWGWLVERREHLDFATIANPKVKPIWPFQPAALPAAATEAEVVHQELVRRKRELTDRQVADAVARATAALRKQRKDQTLELTEDERAAAVAAAEVRQVGGRGVADQVVRAAGLAEEQKDWVDVHEKAPDGTPVWGPRWDKDSIGVLPGTAELVKTLDDRYGAPFLAANYRGHGGGSFADRGRSLDLTLPVPRQANGFYDPAAAIRFLLAIDAAAADLGMEWRVLYDDASVAMAVNGQLGRQRVAEVANTSRNERTHAIENINWHGPLVLHFHLDLAY